MNAISDIRGRVREVAHPPGLLASSGLALRLAWRQLWSEKARLASAIAGVMFACVLVFTQLGFRAALFESATTLIGSMRADLFLMSPMTLASFRPEPMPRVRVSQALGVEQVQAAVPVYLTQSSFRNPETGRRRTIQLIGFDVDAGVLDLPGLAPLRDALKQPDSFAFDTRSRPEFGPVGKMFEERGAFPAQIGNRDMRMVGTISMGTSFGADGNAVMSELNFQRVVKQRPGTMVDLAAIRLKPGADLREAQAALRAIMPPDVSVMTQAELRAHERDYWEKGTPIGFIFTFGSLMGLIVGMVIVYQILFSDIAGHLKEYATLKAMGYSNGHLSRVVLGAAVILAFAGFVPGAIASSVLYSVVTDATFLPLHMTTGRAFAVFGMIFGMCAGAGLLAMRKLRDANPADMF
ncbi:ABC transporter permease DevC [Roseomonas xinghualingensis]|uniref:ABC transporter permease DevC n=1 Tax=Roseomonas xinghualingensis TaxID=2986475 RepID=UPI0021F0FD68|nr:ABC transporter permease DevC [Roseomonas sp. SXEYE001]MCV4205891.1 ABC transporter permease DevC [Roseomonas sp. SXEYE001]